MKRIPSKLMKKRSFREAILFFRSERDLSQTDMAELLGISMRYYQKLESGKATPSLTTLEQTLEGLGVSYLDFFRAPDPPPRPPPNLIKQLIEGRGEELPLRALVAMLERFASQGSEVRASFLAILYDDVKIAAPYLRGKALNKPRVP